MKWPNSCTIDRIDGRDAFCGRVSFMILSVVPDVNENEYEERSDKILSCS